MSKPATQPDLQILTCDVPGHGPVAPGALQMEAATRAVNRDAQKAEMYAVTAAASWLWAGKPREAKDSRSRFVSVVVTACELVGQDWSSEEPSVL